MARNLLGSFSHGDLAACRREQFLKRMDLPWPLAPLELASVLIDRQVGGGYYARKQGDLVSASPRARICIFVNLILSDILVRKIGNKRHLAQH
jgi:hypothetical protein